jgi:hypothetical protein
MDDDERTGSRCVFRGNAGQEHRWAEGALCRGRHLPPADGREFSGLAAIAAMHEGVFAAGAPVPSVGSKIIGESAAAAEVEARLPDGTSRFTTNHFYLDSSGKIARLNVYMKGGL